jgi:hypothetical protein
VKTLQSAIGIAWVVFWIYWLVSAVSAKASTTGGIRRRLPMTGLTALSVFVVVRVVRGGGSAVHSPILGAIGTILFLSGLGLAIWARLHLGSNWGMPMTQRIEPVSGRRTPSTSVPHGSLEGCAQAPMAGLSCTALDTRDP